MFEFHIFYNGHQNKRYAQNFQFGQYLVELLGIDIPFKTFNTTIRSEVDPIKKAYESKMPEPRVAAIALVKKVGNKYRIVGQVKEWQLTYGDYGSSFQQSNDVYEYFKGLVLKESVKETVTGNKNDGTNSNWMIWGGVGILFLVIAYFILR